MKAGCRHLRIAALAMLWFGSGSVTAAQTSLAANLPFLGPEPTTSVLPNSIAMPVSSFPSPADPNEIRITGVGNGSMPWTIVVLLTFLTLIPSLLLCMTPFARLLVVFHFLRQALGLQTTPTNQTLIGLSLVLTFFLMQPVGANIYEASVVPLQSGQITAMEAVERGEPGTPIHAALRSRKRRCSFCRIIQGAAASNSRRPVDADRGSRLHSVGVESWLSNRNGTCSCPSWRST